ncbi:MAG: iron ABC transporter permease [Rickettsiales bacterium]|nr:iron ABC transporter permease [Rickettsiales bacterium]
MRPSRLIFICLLALVLVMAVSPFFALIRAWFQPTLHSGAFHAELLVENTLGSLQLVFSVLALALPMALAGAWAVSRYDFPLRKVVDLSLTLPLAIPGYLLAIIYGQTLSSSGPLQVIIREYWQLSFGEYWFPAFRSPFGAACVLAFALYPYSYILCRAAFAAQSESMTQAALSLGLSMRSAFWRVTMPLIRPALVAGAALIAMETLADFGVVSLYGLPTFTTGIYRSMFGLGDSVLAIRMAGVLMLVIGAMIIIEKKSRASQRVNNNETHNPLQRCQLTGIKGWLVCAACWLPSLIGFYIPIMVLLAWSAHYQHYWLDPLTWSAARHSIVIATCVAAMVSVCALVLTYHTRQSSSFLVTSALRLASLGYALPGTVIAVCIMLPLIAFDRQLSGLVSDITGEFQGLVITGSIFAIVFACSLRFFSLGLHSIDAGMQAITPTLDQVAQSLGATSFDVMWRVHVPMLRSSFFISALIVFVDTAKELPATYVLRPFNYDTLAIRAFAMASDEKYYEAAPSALLLIALGVVAMMILGRYTSKHFAS